MRDVICAVNLETDLLFIDEVEERLGGNTLAVFLDMEEACHYAKAVKLFARPARTVGTLGYRVSRLRKWTRNLCQVRGRFLFR